MCNSIFTIQFYWNIIQFILFFKGTGYFSREKNHVFNFSKKLLKILKILVCTQCVRDKWHKPKFKWEIQDDNKFFT